MRVVHLIARLNDGGPARVLAGLLPELAAQGVDCQLWSGFCGPDEPDLAPRLRDAGLPVLLVPGLGRDPRPGGDLRALAWSLAHLRRVRPHLLHTHTAKAGLLGRVAAATLGIPVLHSYHGHVLHGYFGAIGNAVVRSAEAVLGRIGHCHALTTGQVRELSRDYGIGHRRRWHGLPVCVPAVAPQTADWHASLPTDRPRLLFLGRLVPVKDVGLFLSALAQLHAQRPIHAIIAGDGPERSLVAEARSRGLPITDTGFVPAGQALAVADVLVLSSRNEGQPLVAAEAAGCRVPVVAPPVGGLADLVHLGVVRGAERTPAGLAAAIAKLLDDAKTRRQQIARAAVWADSVTPARLAPRYGALYRRILSGSLLVLLLAGASAGSAVELVQESPRRGPLTGELVQWRLDGGDAAWLTPGATRPILEIREGRRRWRRATFLDVPHHAGPSGPVADGAPRLLLRHSFRQAGEATWRLLDGEAVLAQGSLRVAAGSRPPGPVGLSPHNPRLLAWADGTPYVPLGTNLAWTVGDDRAAAFAALAGRFAAAGGTHVRLWASSWFGQAGDPAYGWRSSQAWLLDQAIASCRAHGLTATIVLDNHHDILDGQPAPRLDLPDPIIATEDLPRLAAIDRQLAVPLDGAWRRRVDDLLARHGADDTVMSWELCNEIDLLGAPRQRLAAWVAAASAYLASHDQDHRLVHVSTSHPPWPGLLRLKHLGLSDLHAYIPLAPQPDDLDEVLLLHRQLDALAENPRRPFLFSEVGFNGREQDDPHGRYDRDGAILRRLMWSGLLLGGCGSGMPWWWDQHLDNRRLWSSYAPLAEAMARIDWRDRGFAPLALDPRATIRILGWRSPEQFLLWPQRQGDTWHARRVAQRLPSDDAPGTQLELPGMSPGLTLAWEARLLADGKPVAAGTATVGPDGLLRLPLPSPRDDACLIAVPAAGR